MTDPIADMLTRIRNANMALLTDVEVGHSKMKESIADILWIAKPDSPLNSIQDIVGKKIGYTSPGSVTNMLILMAMKAQGIDAGKVTLFDPIAPYLEHVGRTLDLGRVRDAGLNVVFDAMHATGAGLLSTLAGAGGTCPRSWYAPTARNAAYALPCAAPGVVA